MKPIILSFLCHLLFAQFLVFTFATRPVAHKPFFVFLGSILENQDFTNLTSYKREAHRSSSKTGQAFRHESGQALPVKFRQSQFNTNEGPAILKPTFSKDIKKGIKEIQKSTFEETTDKESLEKDWAQDLGIELTVPKRRPLRLHQ